MNPALPYRAALACALLACSAHDSSDAAIDVEAGAVGDAGAVGSPDAATSPSLEAGLDATNDTSADVTAADAGPAEVRCGNQGATCPVPSKLCCKISNPFSASYTCIAPVGCTGAASMPIPCDDANDCAAMGADGAVCCASVDTGGGALSVGCALPETCNSADKRILCDPHDFSSCPAGKTCKPSTTVLPDVDVCLD
jgi:hypothetical protein